MQLCRHNTLTAIPFFSDLILWRNRQNLWL